MSVTTGRRRGFRWKRLMCIASLLFLGSAAALVWAARNHAHSMLFFTSAPGAQRTSRPEQLSLREKATVLLRGVEIPRPENVRDPSALDLNFEIVTIDNGRGDTLELWKIPHPEGTGPRVILFHGYSSSKDSLLPAAELLYQLGCECWLVDFYGSGGSSGDSTSFGWLEAIDVDVASRTIERRSPKGLRSRPLVLYGSSMGGAAVMRALADLDTPADAAIVEGVFANFHDTIAQRFRLMKLPAFPAANLLTYFGGRELGFDSGIHNPIDYATRIQIPVLLLHGSHDTRAPASDIPRIYNELVKSADSAESAPPPVFFNAGHQTLPLAAPGTWQQATKKFFDAALPK